ncbi:hypothetical protein PV797_13150 [Clostridiaceae bacterium M8S5]|nr:hypothetical protein PV797_13150 [Clostridiaceae bacterium M8S5]
MNYEKLKEEFMILNNNTTIIDKRFDYSKDYEFVVSKKSFKKLTIGIIILLIVIGIVVWYLLWALTKVKTDMGKFNIMGMLIIGTVITIFAIYECHKKRKKIYPKIKLEYHNKNIHYCDGLDSFDFKINDIYEVEFINPQPKSKRWIVVVVIKRNKRINIDILNMDNPKLLFKLLTSYNKNIKIYG